MNNNQYSEIKEIIQEMNSKLSSIMVWINGDENIKNTLGTHDRIETIDARSTNNRERLDKIIYTVGGIAIGTSIIVNALGILLNIR